MNKNGQTKKFQFAGNLSLPKDIWSPDKTVFKAIDAAADSRTGLFPATVGAIMRGLGWTDGRMTAGLLIDFINHFPDEVRMAIAAGIAQGLGLMIQRKDDALLVDLVQLYDTLALGKDAEKRRPSGIILPGG